jgi:polyhydroxyalkanoate synthesis regulator phasin
MGGEDINLLFQQMGEVLQGLASLSSTIEIRHRQVDKLHDLLRGDVTILRQEQRDLEEKLDCVICIMQHDLEALRTGAVASGASIEQLVQAVEELRRPVAEIVALRSCAAGLILGLGLLGSAAMWLAEPAYRWVIEHNYLKQ